MVKVAFEFFFLPNFVYLPQNACGTFDKIFHQIEFFDEGKGERVETKWGINCHDHFLRTIKFNSTRQRVNKIFK